MTLRQWYEKELAETEQMQKEIGISDAEMSKLLEGQREMLGLLYEFGIQHPCWELPEEVFSARDRP